MSPHEAQRAGFINFCALLGNMMVIYSSCGDTWVSNTPGVVRADPFVIQRCARLHVISQGSFSFIIFLSSTFHALVKDVASLHKQDIT